jgi:hypothetical protein
MRALALRAVSRMGFSQPRVSVFADGWPPVLVQANTASSPARPLRHNGRLPAQLRLHGWPGTRRTP